MKVCTKCGCEKLPDAFSNDKQKRDGKSSACKVCVNKYQHEYKSSRRELLKVKARARYTTAKNKCTATNKAWANKNKDKVSIAQKAWVKRNPAKVAARNRKYQLSKRNAVPKWFDADKVASIYADARKYGLHVDHIVPIRSKLVCGLHVHTNLEALPEVINKSKSNKYWPDMP